ncbi:VOC family protein [Leptospira interrogans]|uniref:VOC family protein n=1 Tax=Leptospira interrogans TaxID=173 RepID=UPI0007730DD4|nr:VOC family protein [Leptospira interrogans]
MIIVEGINYFLIPAENPEASAKFYSDIFDFESLDEKSGEYVIMGLDSINIKLQKISGFKNSLGENKIPVLSFVLDVDDFTEAIAELEENKISIVRGPETNQSGEFLHFLDPSGNVLEISYKD